MRTVSAAFLILLVVSAGVVRGQSDCSDGTKYDDGVWEEGSGLNSDNVGRGSYVMRIDPPFSPAAVESVCLCWTRTGTDSSIGFDINVWAADGPSGKPGTLLGKVAATANSVPSAGVGITGAFYRYNLAAAGVVASGPVYIGPAWNPKSDRSFFICEDQSPATPSRPVYLAASGTVGAPDTPPDLDPHLVKPAMRALGIRAKFSATTLCAPTSTALCLNQGRFRVEATYLTGSGQAGQAQTVKLTDETGYLWFFSSTNVEAVVKVLNACGLNSRYWVFAGGLTNVQVVLTVTDTETGNVKTYTNPQGKAFQPIQDTAALPCN